MIEVVGPVVLGIVAVSIVGATADATAAYFKRKRRRKAELEARMREAAWSDPARRYDW